MSIVATGGTPTLTSKNLLDSHKKAEAVVHLAALHKMAPNFDITTSYATMRACLNLSDRITVTSQESVELGLFRSVYGLMLDSYEERLTLRNGTFQPWCRTASKLHHTLVNGEKSDEIKQSLKDFSSDLKEKFAKRLSEIDADLRLSSDALRAFLAQSYEIPTINALKDRVEAFSLGAKSIRDNPTSTDRTEMTAIFENLAAQYLAFESEQSTRITRYEVLPKTKELDVALKALNSELVQAKKRVNQVGNKTDYPQTTWVRQEDHIAVYATKQETDTSVPAQTPEPALPSTPPSLQS